MNRSFMRYMQQCCLVTFVRSLQAGHRVHPNYVKLLKGATEISLIKPRYGVNLSQAANDRFGLPHLPFLPHRPLNNLGIPPEATSLTIFHRINAIDIKMCIC
jgi:hypothetical protein